MPLVSICLPTLNARRFLEPRMASIMAQTLTDWELIVCDSYSDDGTWEYLERYADDARVKMYRVPRAGLYAGWNECLRRGGGEYIYVATADDTMTPDCLEKLVGALENAGDQSTAQSPESLQPALRSSKSEEGSSVFSLSAVASSAKAGLRSAVCGLRSPPRATPAEIAVCDFDVIDENGDVVPCDLPKWPRRFYGEWMQKPHIRDGRTEFLIHATLGNVWITMTTVLFRRSLLERTGMFREDAGPSADNEWEMRACLASDIVWRPERLATWRQHDEQASRVTPADNPWEQPRRVLDCLHRVLRDPASGIPPQWKTVPGWDQRILLAQRCVYRDTMKLYGNIAREHPGRFFRSVIHALRHDPRFLARQLARGFRWDPALSPDILQLASDRIKEFNTGWPPYPVSRNETRPRR